MPETLPEWLHWLTSNATTFLLPFLLVISVLVFVHEWGHYIVARMCGVKVEVFSIGFGKKLFGWTDKAGTHWQVALFPLGGYVKMFGDTDPASAGHSDQIADGAGAVRPMTAAERDQAFFSKSVGKRAAIVFAGPAINFLFAIIVLAGIYSLHGKTVTAPMAAAVIVGGAGDVAGIQPMDRIVAIDGKPVRKFADIQRSVAITLDKPLTLTVQRGSETLTIPATPRKETVQDRFGFPHSRGVLGLISAGNALDMASITAVNGQSGDVKALITANMGQKAVLTLPAGPDKTQDVRVFLDPSLNEGLIKGTDTAAGLFLSSAEAPREKIVFGAVDATIEAVRESWFISVGTLQALGQMIIGTRSAQELGGIIRIGAVTGDAAQAGFIALLTLAALLSLNLGLINLLPIPMLDGGHLVFYGIEALRGKPVPDRVQDVALRMGFYILIGIMLFANVNDVVQLAR